MTTINKQANTIVSDEKGLSSNLSLYDDTESFISLNADSNQTDVLVADYSADLFFDLYLADITIITSIDKLSLSNIIPDLNLWDKTLTQNSWLNYIMEYDGPLKKKKKEKKKPFYNRIRTYKSVLNKVNILYSRKKDSSLSDNKRFTLIIHDVTPEIVDIFDSIFTGIEHVFEKYNIYPKMSSLELAWDFYTSRIGIYHLKEKMDLHLFLKYQGHNSMYFHELSEDFSPSLDEGNTFYSTNIRVATKGTRSYIKQDFCRFELLLKRRILKGLNITFPLKPDHLKMDFSKYFEFRCFNPEKLLKYENYRSRKEIARGRGIPVKGFKKVKTWDQVIKSRLKSEVKWACTNPMMKAVEMLKLRGYKDCYRFLECMENENKIMYQVADEQRFGFL